MLTLTETPAIAGVSVRVSEGTRTPDRLDHNQELYQLSYAHRGGLNLAATWGREKWFPTPPAFSRLAWKVGA